MAARFTDWFRSIILIIWLSLFLCPDNHAQNFNVRSYTTEMGLSHNNVRAMVRDSSGYLWLATWDGLSRFDGHDFRNYFHSAEDTSSIPFFSVYGLSLDRYNNLWLQTDGAEVVKYNRASDNFTVVRNLGGVRLGRVHFINTDRQGYLWITTDSLLMRWDDRLHECRSYTLFDKSGNRMIFSVWPGYVTTVDESEIWIAGPVAYKFSCPGKDSLILQGEYPLKKNPSRKFIDFDFRIWYKYFKAPDGSSWIFSNQGLYRLNENAGFFEEYHGEVTEMEDSGQSLLEWGWPEDGIYIYNTVTRLLTHIPQNATGMAGAILADEPSSIWFTSMTQTGVYLGIKHVIITRNFFRNKLFLDQDSAQPVVYAVALDKYKKLLAGLRGYDHMLEFAPNGQCSDFDKLPYELFRKGMHVRSIKPIENGIWIGYFGGLLQFYNYDTRSFQDYFPETNTARTIMPYKNGIIIATNSLFFFNPATLKTDTLWLSDGPEGIFKLYEDENGIIWGSGAHGRLLRYDPVRNQGSVIHLSANKCNIEDVISGTNGDMWLALLGEGVCRYNQNTGTFRYYTTSEGLSNNTTYNLLSDRSGNIWVSTNAGISRINPLNNTIKTFGPTDGLKISEFNSGAKFSTPEGEFIFGGMGGYVRFFPDSLIDSQPGRKFRIMLTGLEVSGLPFYPKKPLDETDTVIFRKGDDDFHLSFSSSDFINSDKIIYRYSLNKVNKGWIETGYRNRNINYSNLDPGWYRLTIQATDAAGEWEVTRNLTVRITPIFFETLFFIIFSTLIVLLSISLTIYFHIRNIREKGLKKLDEMKLQSLRGQMNPHFIFNSLNSINYFISNNDRLSANRYIADFSRLIRSILSNMGSNFIPVSDEISSIEDYLRIEHLRFGDKFDYYLDISGMDGLNNLEVSPGIVQPFIENAIWHGVRPLENRKGYIQIILVPSATCIRCTIKDNGIGRAASVMKRDQDSMHKSRGINLVAERLLLTSKLTRVNYSLEITDLDNSKEETGTKVEVDIPVKLKG